MDVRRLPDVGDQSTPVISSRMKLRSMTPFDDVSEVKCMVLPFGIALFRRSRRHLRLSLDREHEWEHPHGYCVHGSHLLARCHGLAHAINLKRIPSNPFSCPPTRPTVDTLACVSHPPRPGQAADRRWKPDSSTVRPRSPAGTALAVACTHCRLDPTSRRSGSQAAPTPPAVDTRWRPDPTTPRSGNRAAAPSRLPGSLATGRRLAQEQPSGLSSDE